MFDSILTLNNPRPDHPKVYLVKEQQTLLFKNVNCRLMFMQRKANCLFADTRKLVQCHFDYCCSSCYSGISQEALLCDIITRLLQIIYNSVVVFKHLFG
jgi:hypothetical protein